jgi:hypothetical protein
VQFTAADKIQCANLVRTLVEIVLEDSRIVGYKKKQGTTAKWKSKVERIEVPEYGAGLSNGRRLKHNFADEDFVQFCTIYGRNFIWNADLRSL